VQLVVINFAAVPLTAYAYAQTSPGFPASLIPGLSQVFVLVFVMFGSIKIIVPFVALMMGDAEEQSCRKSIVMT